MITMLPARWLVDDRPDPTDFLLRSIVRRAMADIGIEELVGQKNRSPYIDECMDAVGSPRGMSWCAAICRRWWAESGALVPPTEAGAVKAWVAWAKATDTWRTAEAEPVPGWAVVYDFEHTGLGDHIGVVARVAERGTRTVEGNTSYGGADRNGIVVAFKPASGGILGYIVPTLAKSASSA